MDFKKIFTESQLVEISVARLGNQKITKSILNQLPDGYKIKFPFQFESIKIIGFVNEKGAQILYVENERIYKQSFDTTINFLRTGYDQHRISDIQKYVKLDKDKDYSPYGTFEQLSDEDKQRFINAFDTVKLFYAELLKHQIFI